jgi:hypothetical protein
MHTNGTTQTTVVRESSLHAPVHACWSLSHDEYEAAHQYLLLASGLQVGGVVGSYYWLVTLNCKWVEA